MGFVIVVRIREGGPAVAYDAVTGQPVMLPPSGIPPVSGPGDLARWSEAVHGLAAQATSRLGLPADRIELVVPPGADPRLPGALLHGLSRFGITNAVIITGPGLVAPPGPLLPPGTPPGPPGPMRPPRPMRPPGRPDPRVLSGPAPVGLEPVGAHRRRTWLLVVIAAIVLGALVGGAVIGYPVVRNALRGGPVAPSVPAAGSSTSPTTTPTPTPTSSPTPAGTPTPTTAPTSTTSRFPTSDPLPRNSFVVPRGAGTKGRLYVASATGAARPHRLATPSKHRVNGPTLSADRRSLVYLDRTAGSARTMAADGSGDRLLFRRGPAGCPEIGHLSWSPADSSVMVLECITGPTRSRLMVVDDRGRLIRRLAVGRRQVHDPVISFDGRSVAYWASDRAKVTDGAIYRMALDGASAPQRLAKGRYADPAWSPDGKRIAFTRRSGRNSDVLTINATGGKPRLLLSGRRTEQKPAWSPDGKQLLIISDRRAAKARASYDLYRINADGRGLRAVGVASRNLSTPVWGFR